MISVYITVVNIVVIIVDCRSFWLVDMVTQENKNTTASEFMHTVTIEISI